jgi:hypothetical protein
MGGYQAASARTATGIFCVIVHYLLSFGNFGVASREMTSEVDSLTPFLCDNEA